jgi:CspA family cold shock protein
MSPVGVVRFFDAREGWGVIDAADFPGGCWVHFSALAMPGFRQLAAGQQVSLRAEPADQDGFAFRAVRVWIGDEEPVDLPGSPHHSSAYGSSLTLIPDELS